MPGSKAPEGYRCRLASPIRFSAQLVGSVGLRAETYASAQAYLDRCEPERPGVGHAHGAHCSRLLEKLEVRCMVELIHLVGTRRD